LSEWKTSTKAYETDDVIGYLIGYFRDINQAVEVKQEIKSKYGVDVMADIRLVGLVQKRPETLREKEDP